MDKMTLNMTAGAVLSALLVLFGANTFVDILYPKGGGPEAPAAGEQQAAAPGRDAGSPPPSGGGPAQQSGQGVEALLANASVQAGEVAAKKCATCHAFEQGAPNKVGPNLHNVVGRQLAAVEGFAYSQALKEKGGNWDYKLLDSYLLDPKASIPGNKMAFAGIKKDSERADVIAYLRSITNNPPPLPAAAPAAPAAGAQPEQGAAQPAQGAAPAAGQPPAQGAAPAAQGAPEQGPAPAAQGTPPAGVKEAAPTQNPAGATSGGTTTTR